MTLSNPLPIAVILFALLSLVFTLLTIGSLKKRNVFKIAMNFVVTLLMISLSCLFGFISIALQGYHALTKEELAAIVKIEPAGEQMFRARFTLPDGRVTEFTLAGDQLYVDAHILKWKPLANIIGLHTSYELDRVAGRYAMLNDETTKVRTVYTLSQDRPVNMFELRRRFAFLNPVLDAEYGSATFVNVKNGEEYRLLVSTTGLLVRKNEQGTGQ